eukprot:c9119_g1_i1.p2 GENE.c9119_g1_i1~~c9119_g1_i1.p2  ORF type:complete len:233 (+),score=43.54 c9119_g1_i1:1030-1728(+)
MGDSFYEYMLKLYLQTSQSDTRFRDMYLESASAVLDHLVQRSTDGYTYIAEMKGHQLEHTMEHLSCFFGGLLALGAHYLENVPDRHMEVARELARTCVEGYRKMRSGIGPEAWRFTERGMEAERRSEYILRPETVETLFYMYRLTGETKYQDWGWEIFQNLDKLKVESGGYSGVISVDTHPLQLDDHMQSFFIAETLKYLYLLFAPSDLISLDEFVFNTEAHPLRKFAVISQ